MLEVPPIMPFCYASKNNRLCLLYARMIHAALWQLELGVWLDLTCCHWLRRRAGGAFRTDSKEGQQLHPSIHQSGHAGWSI